MHASTVWVNSPDGNYEITEITVPLQVSRSGVPKGGPVMAKGSDILTRWQLLSPYLNRRQRSLWAAAEAETIGHGGVALVSIVTGISGNAISPGMRKVTSTKGATAGSLVP